jgi:Endoplasmic reticulum vesicle transporter
MVGLAQIKYLINIVPTIYEYANGEQIETYQYQATMHRLPVDVSSGHYPLPGR